MASRDSNRLSTFYILQWKSFTRHEGKRESRQSTKANKAEKRVVFSSVEGQACIVLLGRLRSLDNRRLRETSANPTRRPSERL